MAEVHQVVYIGNKPRKGDSANNNPLRFWEGLGDIQQVTKAEASKLAMHVDIWRDVTGWSAEQIGQLVNTQREYFRGRERDQHQKHIKTVLSAVSREQLVEELALRDRVESFTKPSESAMRVRQLEAPQPPSPPGAPRGRPNNTVELGMQITDAIYKVLDDPVGIDEEGQPRLEAINAKLGYSISEEELADVWRALQEPPKAAAPKK